MGEEFIALGGGKFFNSAEEVGGLDNAAAFPRNLEPLKKGHPHWGKDLRAKHWLLTG